MKTKYLMVAIIPMFFIFACSTQNQTKNENKEYITQQVNEKVQSKDFKIEVNYANPMGGKSIYLTSGYDLTIRNDSAIAYLPYFGRAYSLPYGGDGGIKFREQMKEYTATPKKKNGEWAVRFTVRTSDSDYEVNVDIYSNGKSMLNVSSNQRQPITYNGEIVLE